MASEEEQIAAERFIDTGEVLGVPESRLAETCNELIRSRAQSSTTAGLKLAEAFVERAQPHGGVLLSTAWRALGWVNVVAARYGEAREAYTKARRHLQRDPLMRSRIDRIMIDVYMYLGDYAAARRCARRALATFKRMGANEDVAKTEVNYANLLHRQDRHREARDLYARAGEFFRRRGNEVATALCHYNLANTMVQLFEFDAAQEHYEYALDKFTSHGFDLYAVDCRNGLAWLRMLRGDYHIALKELAACEEGYRHIKQPRGVVLCQLDKAESFLALNLFNDAEQAARQAGKGARKIGIAYEAAKADFFLAQALYGAGRTSHSRKVLEEAERGFTKAQSGGFRAAVELFKARFEDSQSRGRRIDHARRRFSQAQLPLWEAVCDIQRLHANPENQTALRRLNRNAAARTVPHLVAERHTLLGDRDARRGRKQNAVEHWRRAADVLDAVRVKLPPVELRDAFSYSRRSPHISLVHAELPDRPGHAAAWSERYRTAGIWATSDSLLKDDPDRDRAERSLAALAQQVTSLAGRIDGSGKRTSSAANTGPTRQLQRSVRDGLALLESDPESQPESVAALADRFSRQSARLPIVQFHRDRGDLHAFVHQGSEPRWVHYVNGAEQLSALNARWRFMVSSRSHSDTGVSKQELQEEHRLLTELGEWLWTPLEIPRRTRKVLLLPDGDLYNLPWAALRVDGRALAERHRFLLSPSLRHFEQAKRCRVSARHGEAFVGLTDGLNHVSRELDALSADGDLTVRRNCRRDDVPAGGSARLWHFTGHATLRADNPFYSSLEMADGPFFAADFRLRRVKLGLAMLAGCRTGQQVSLPGEETTGLVRSLLEMGARNVIASGWAVADHSTAHWIVSFYEQYLSGCDLTESVSRANENTREKHPSAYHWAAFSLYGAG